MANDMNQCNFTGRLGADPEVRFLPSGDPVANIRLAVGKQWRDRQSGQKQEDTAWLTLVAFGRIAEVIQQYTGKGSRVRATTEVRVRKWQDQSGQDRYATEFVIREFQMLDGAPQQGQQGGRQQSQGMPQGHTSGQTQGGHQQQATNQPGGFDDSWNDEIPF